MSRTFTIGRNGDQPFPIGLQADTVSAQHARVTIDDDGVWTLEDLKSSNGTMIRDNDGNLVRVGRIQITPDTYVVLGTNNSHGVSFYARHLLKPGNFIDEFTYISSLYDKNVKQLERLERNSRLLKQSISAVSIIALVASFFLPPSQGIMLLRLGSGVAALYTLLVDPLNRRKKLREHGLRFMQCPNPACHNTLSAGDVKNMQCSRCRAQ